MMMWDTHNFGDLVGFGKVAEVTNSVWNGSRSKAGDGIWCDYPLLHQGMPNASQNTLRP